MVFLLSACSAEEQNIDAGLNGSLDVVSGISADATPDASSDVTPDATPDATPDVGSDSGQGVAFDLASSQLLWTAPSEREDRSILSLSEIAGYRIYYGSRQGDYLNTIEIDDTTAQSYDVSDFPAGTYYIVMTVYDMEGRESRYSRELVVRL